MDRFPQPPDPPEEGNCRRCKTFITRDELLVDGCTECDDLLIQDMAKLWAGRPKGDGSIGITAYGAMLCKTTSTGFYTSVLEYEPFPWQYYL